MKALWMRAACCCVVALLFAALLPVAVLAEEPPLVAEPDAYIVMDAQTGQVLASKNADQQRYPASITKIVTLALALEMLEDYKAALWEPVQVSYTATHSLIPGAASVALTEEEIVFFNDLLHATQIRSANDAANVIAEYMSGSIEGFAEAMTAKARELGLQNSNFCNPSGLPDASHVTTAYDMAVLTRWALSVPGFREIFAATNYTMAPTNKQEQQRVWSTGNMILVPNSYYYYPGVTGSKQGHTNDAQYTLATTAQRGDTELICIVLQCATNEMKYEATTTLLDYCFNNFTRVTIPASQLAACSVPVYGGGTDPLGSIDVSAGADATFLLHNSLSLEDVIVQANVPERYVIGQPFEPVVTLSLPENSLQRCDLMSLPLTWSSLDDLFAANTASPWQEAVQEYPMAPWLVFGVLALLVFLITSRILYVRHRRMKRRRARIAAARSQVPIRVAKRPPPPPAARRPAANGKTTVYRRPDLQVVGRQTPPTAPRRAGRNR